MGKGIVSYRLRFEIRILSRILKLGAQKVKLTGILIFKGNHSILRLQT